MDREADRETAVGEGDVEEMGRRGESSVGRARAVRCALDQSRVRFGSCNSLRRALDEYCAWVDEGISPTSVWLPLRRRGAETDDLPISLIIPATNVGGMSARSLSSSNASRCGGRRSAGGPGRWRGKGRRGGDREGVGDGNALIVMVEGL